MLTLYRMSNNLILNYLYKLNKYYHIGYILYLQHIRLNHMKQCM